MIRICIPYNILESDLNKYMKIYMSIQLVERNILQEKLFF